MHNQDVSRQIQRLQDLLKRATEASGDNIEMQSHWAKYICVLGAGLMENALKEIYVSYAHSMVSKPVANYVSSNLRRINNPKAEKFLETAAAFNDSWKSALEEYISIDGRAEAMNSIMNNRHSIAHGKDSNSHITLVQMKDYLTKSVQVLEFIEKQCRK